MGDCNAVTWANQRRLVTAKLGRKEVYPKLEQVIQFYKTQNPTFDVNGGSTNGPGSSSDKGMILQDGLNYLWRNGGPDGVKPFAFARVDPKNLQAVHQAISIFGSLWIGFHTYPSTVKQWQEGRPFSVPAGEAQKGGHAVIVGGYVPGMKCVTWGGLHHFTDDYWTSGNVFEAWAVIWPEHLGTRSFMLGVNLDQLASEMKKLTGNDIVIPDAPFSNLYFIKERNVGSGKTEVHIAENSSSYSIPTGHNVAAYQPDEWKNGKFDIDGGDLYFIKLRTTGTGVVEIHRTTATSGYRDFDLHSGTAFSLVDVENGIWTVDDEDLYLIKTKNVASGKIEVHRAGHTNYKAFDIHETTSLPQSEAGNGTWVVFGQNLYFIKYRNTSSQNVEIHLLRGGDGYQHDTVSQTWFNVADGDNGIWDIGPDRDLYFIKTRNTGSGRAEVHIATAASLYQEVYHYASWISQTDGPNGTWCVR